MAFGDEERGRTSDVRGEPSRVLGIEGGELDRPVVDERSFEPDALAGRCLAVLVGQASVLGVILGAVALVLRRTTVRTVPRPPATTGSTNLRMRSSLRTDSYLAPSPGLSGSGTPTTPLTVPEVDR